MKTKLLDFSVLKEEISPNNVLKMAELIAFMELRFQIGYSGSRAQKMYADLYADIKHKNELGHTFSDSYDLVQEGALYLCGHYGEHLSDVLFYSKKGKPITIEIACIRKMMKLINRKISDYYRRVSLDALTPVSEPSCEIKEEVTQDYTVYDTIVESLNLTENMRIALECRQNGLSYPEIGRVLSRAQATVYEYFMLKHLIITQWLRTKGAAKRAQLETTKTMLEICDDCGLQVDTSTCWQEDNNLYKKIAADNVNFAINGELNTDGLELCLLVNRTDTELIISDDPVVIGNEFQPNYGLGVECAGVYFFMPISPFHILLLYDNKMYGLQRSELSVSDIQYLNNKQLKKAYNNLYARDRNSLLSIMDRFNAYLASKKLPSYVGRRSFPAGNNILKLNQEFVPYIDKCKFVFTRGNVNECMIKGMFWGDQFSETVYMSYFSNK